MEFNQQFYRAPAVPKLSKKNISSSVLRGASAVSSSTSLKPKLRSSIFSFRKPKSDVAEDISKSTNYDSLEETNRILIEIQNQLALDFAMRIAEEKEQNKRLKSTESKKKFSAKESALERAKSVGGFIKSQADKVLAPTKSIFQKVIEFFKIILTGIVLNTGFKWLENKENQKKLGNFFAFFGEHWKWIAATLGTVLLVDIITKVVLAIKGIMAAFALLTTPVGLGILAGIALAAGLVSIGKNLREQREKRQQQYERAITGTNYDTSVSGKPAQIIPYRPSGAKNDNSNIFGLIKSGFGATFSKGGEIFSPSFSYSPQILKFSPGGTVPGRGSGKVDTVPAMLAEGEYVVRTFATRLFRPFLTDINENAGRRFDELRQGIIGFLALVLKQEENIKKFSQVLKNLSNTIEELKRKKLLRTGGAYGRRKLDSSNLMPMASGATNIANVSNVNVSMNAPVSNGPVAFGKAGVIKKSVATKEKTYTSISSKSKPKTNVVSMTLPPQKSKPPQIPTPTRTATDVPAISSVNMADPYRMITPGIYGIFV